MASQLCAARPAFTAAAPSRRAAALAASAAARTPIPASTALLTHVVTSNQLTASSGPTLVVGRVGGVAAGFARDDVSGNRTHRQSTADAGDDLLGGHDAVQQQHLDQFAGAVGVAVDLREAAQNASCAAVTPPAGREAVPGRWSQARRRV